MRCRLISLSLLYLMWDIKVVNNLGNLPSEPVVTFLVDQLKLTRHEVSLIIDLILDTMTIPIASIVISEPYTWEQVKACCSKKTDDR